MTRAIRLLSLCVLLAACSTAAAGELTFRFIGNEAFEISDGTTTLLSDFPYRSGYSIYMEYAESEVRPRERSLCLVTHRHADHVEPSLVDDVGCAFVGPQEVARLLKGVEVLPLADAIEFGPLTIEPRRTLHRGTEHYSHLVTWHGLRLYFVGDTETPEHVPDELDVLFVSPWLREALVRSGRPWPAKKTVIYHHTVDETVDCDDCLVPRQGQGFTLAYPESKVAGPEIPADVQAAVRERVELKYSPGIAIGAIDANGRTYFAQGSTALSGGSAVGEDTVFEIGSISKAFTGILLAHLVEQGKLGFEDPLAGYLPEGNGVPARGETPIRLIDLATHHSGLPRMPDNIEPGDPLNPFADYTLERAYTFLAGHELRRDVGAEYEYSNFGAGMLGHVLELATGKSYEELVVETIARPLGMPSTSIALDEDQLARVARPHAQTVEVKLWDIPALAGAGGIRSTARDMLTFLAANMGLTESSLAAAMANSHRPRADAMGAMRVGLGWHIRQGDPPIVWHNGGTGGHKSFAGFLADGSLGVVVFGNSTDPIEDLGFHLLDPTAELAVRKKSKKIPLFKRD